MTLFRRPARLDGSRTRTFEIGARRVSMTRDESGVAVVTGRDDLDLAAGFGWAHAHDRMLQMALVRLIGQGRLSECLKSTDETLAIDLFMRRMRFAADAAYQASRLEGEPLALVEAYAEGVNTRLASGHPLELRLAGYKPEPWRPADTLLTLALASYVGLAQTQQEAEKLIVESIQRGVSLPRLRDVFRPHLDGLTAEIVELVKAARVELPLAAGPVPVAPVLRGSNNWIVSPRRSATGSVLHANDPHLEVNRLPAVWYEVIGRIDGDYRIGVTIPGIPGVVMGRSRALSASFTYGFMDMIDYFLEDVRGGRCRRGDGWVELAEHEEVIARKGASPIVIRVHENETGVLETLGERPPDDGVYLCRAYAPRRRGAAESLQAVLDLWRARDVPEAQAAVRGCALSANWLLGDRAGRIAYQQSGLLPLRAHSGLHPVPAWDERFLWKGFAPGAALTSRGDPEDGILATANDAWNPHGGPLVVNLAMGDDRAARARQLLAGKARHSLDDMKAYQRDVVSLQADRFLERLAPLLPDAEASRLLVRWDRRYDAASRGAVLFERLYARLLSALFGDGLFGADFWRTIAAETSFVPDYFSVLDRVLLDGDEALWFGAEGRDAFFRRVAAEALAGVDAAALPAWGDGHRIVMTQIFFGGALPRILGFDRGPYALEGGRATIVQGQVFTSAGRSTSFAPSWRCVTDLARDDVETALAGGPSDRRFSRHYATDVERWLGYRYKVLRATPGPPPIAISTGPSPSPRSGQPAR